MPHGLVHESEEKLRAHFLHTGILSAPGLYADPTRLSADNVSERVKFREKISQNNSARESKADRIHYS